MRIQPWIAPRPRPGRRPPSGLQRCLDHPRWMLSVQTHKTWVFCFDTAPRGRFRTFELSQTFPLTQPIRSSVSCRLKRRPAAAAFTGNTYTAEVMVLRRAPSRHRHGGGPGHLARSHCRRALPTRPSLSMRWRPGGSTLEKPLRFHSQSHHPDHCASQWRGRVFAAGDRCVIALTGRCLGPRLK